MSVFVLTEVTIYEGISIAAVCETVDRAKQVAQGIVETNAEGEEVPSLDWSWKATGDGYWEAPVREFASPRERFPGSYFHEFEIREWKVQS